MAKLRMASWFAGIEGIGLAAERTGGFEVVLQSEKDKYAQQVLKHHYPHVPLIEDIKDVTVDVIQRQSIGRIDVFTGGFPCQDVSMAGRREGLVGKQSRLWFEYLRLIQQLRPQWVVIENVPGLLSSHDGRDFATILRGLVECGYCVAYRVLDAQYFGVAQRRRRVFIVGCLGSGRAVDVLFERQGSTGNIEPSRNEGQEIAATIGTRSATRGRVGYDNLIPYRKLRHDGYVEDQVGSTLKTISRKNDVSDLIVSAVDVRNLRLQPDGVSGTLQAKSNDGYSLNYQNPVMFQQSADREVRFIQETGRVASAVMASYHRSREKNLVILQQNGSQEVRLMQGNGHVAGAITAAPGQVKQRNLLTDCEYYIRRLTPLECERLQGFPDGWTAIAGHRTRSATRCLVMRWRFRWLNGSCVGCWRPSSAGGWNLATNHYFYHYRRLSNRHDQT